MRPSRCGSFVPLLLAAWIMCVFASAAHSARVARVIDGDTVVLDDGTTIRYIGVDSPEPKGHDKSNDLIAKQATAYNEILVLNCDVRLEYDVDRTDRFGRTLVYAYTVDSVFVNAEMLRAGWAKVLTVPPNVLYTEVFRKCQEEAQAAGLGLWRAEIAKKVAAPQALTEATKYYITKTGSKYHREGCRYLSKSANEITKDDATARGYGPCSVCIGAAPASEGSSSYTAPPTTSSPGRCQAITKKGAQCKRNAKTGSSYCWQHGG